jgi:release factor glutamine methyltransferase
LCSGTGCISLALAHHLPSVNIDALDISPSAVLLAKLNQRIFGISAKKLRFHHFDLFNLKRDGPFSGYDLVVSNPPYISPEEFKSLDASVRDFEDERALRTRDENGVEFYEFIAKSDFLFQSKTQSRLIVEIGETQGPLVKKILKEANFTNVQILKDLAGSDRVVEGRKPSIM